MAKLFVAVLTLTIVAAYSGVAFGQEAMPEGVSAVPSAPPSAPPAQPSQPTYSYPPPASPPPPPPAPAPRPAAPEARTIEAYQGPSPASPPAAPETAAGAAPVTSSFPGKLAAGAYLGLMKGSGPETGLAFRGWPHEMVGLQGSLSLNAWGTDSATGGDPVSTSEISPLLKVMIAFLRGAASRMYVAALGGPLLVKPAGADMGVGIRGGVDLGIETLVIKESGVALDVAGGVSYFSYKAPELGNGLRTHLTLGFNYYF